MNHLPVSNLSGFISTPMILEAPASLHPIKTASPTAPKPHTAQVDPFSTFAVFKAAPYPVEIPHPRRHTFPRSAASLT